MYEWYKRVGGDGDRLSLKAAGKSTGDPPISSKKYTDEENLFCLQKQI